MVSMEGSKKPLVISRVLSIIILIGVIGIASTPFTTLLTPLHPRYDIHDYSESFTLSDYSPTIDFGYLLADKIIIQELTTNGSAVNIGLYPIFFEDGPYATIENVTEIRDGLLTIAKHRFGPELEICPNFRISRYNNQSVEGHLMVQIWSQYYPDYIVMGPSFLLLLTIPLFIVVMKNWGRKPTSRGYGLLLILIISGIFISPISVYWYNQGYTPIMHQEVVTIQNDTLVLNSSNSVQRFNLTTETSVLDNFTRIAEFTTNNCSVSLIITREGVGSILTLPNITAGPSGLIQFTMPNNVTATYTFQFSRLSENATVNLAVQSVQIYYTYWIDPSLYYLSTALGITFFVISLIIPRESKHETLSESKNDSFSL